MRRLNFFSNFLKLFFSNQRHSPKSGNINIKTLYIANKDKAAGMLSHPQGSICLAPFTSRMGHDVPKMSQSLTICALAHNYTCVVFSSMSSHVHSDPEWWMAGQGLLDK